METSPAIDILLRGGVGAKVAIISGVKLSPDRPVVFSHYGFLSSAGTGSRPISFL